MPGMTERRRHERHAKYVEAVEGGEQDGDADRQHLPPAHEPGVKGPLR